MVDERRIEDTLDDIKRIIFYYSDSIDYSVYIKELVSILNMIKVAKQNEKLKKSSGLTKLEERAKLYLAKIRVYQSHFENQEVSEKEQFFFIKPT